MNNELKTSAFIDASGPGSKKRRLNPLDGILALAGGIQKGSKKLCLSQDEIALRTNTVWANATTAEKKAMSILGMNSMINCPSRKVTALEDQLILETLPGLEPNKNSKINFPIEQLMMNPKLKQCSRKHMSEKPFHFKKIAIVDDKQLGSRAKVVLRSPIICKVLFNALQKQKIRKTGNYKVDL